MLVNSGVFARSPPFQPDAEGELIWGVRRANHDVPYNFSYKGHNFSDKAHNFFCKGCDFSDVTPNSPPPSCTVRLCSNSRSAEPIQRKFPSDAIPNRS